MIAARILVKMEEAVLMELTVIDARVVLDTQALIVKQVSIPIEMSFVE